MPQRHHMQTHHVSVLPFQKPRQRDPVPDLPRLHTGHPHWSGTLLAPAERPQPPNDWGVPGQQQEAVQQGRPGVSVETSSPPPCIVSPLHPRLHQHAPQPPCPSTTTLQELHHSHSLSGTSQCISQQCALPLISEALSLQSLLRGPAII